MQRPSLASTARDIPEREGDRRLSQTRDRGRAFSPRDSASASRPSGGQTEDPDGERARDVAVVGLACRFPGAADARAFWRNLIGGVDAVGAVPADRWDPATFDSVRRNVAGKRLGKSGGFLDDIDRFDARFFNINPREARGMDPQQRLLLEAGWHCIEDSGIALAELQEVGTAVFAGAMGSDYLKAGVEAGNTDSYTTLGTVHGLLANRVSYALGLSGPSLAVDAAHASSLVALHEARGCLLLGEARYALAAGVNLNFHPQQYVSFSRAGMLSPEGRCKTFDQSADGYVPGEGVAVLLLQPLADAVAAGHRIHGVIAGSAVNHGGHARSLTVPGVEAQRRVMLSAYEDAGFGPESVTFVETHGTGTPLGDAVEVEALKQVFGSRAVSPRSCALGAVKTNIGHLEACSGLAGVIKVLLMMRHRRIPANLHFQNLSPAIDLTGSPFRLALESEPWESADSTSQLRAGVSSFGIGGTNAHVLLTAFPGDGSRDELVVPEEASAARYPFVLSARTPESLEALVERWRLFLGEERTPAPRLRDACATLARGRVALACRTGTAVASWQDVRAFLDGWPDVQPAADAEVADDLENHLSRWLDGGQVDDKVWRSHFPDRTYAKVALPLYPFERQRFWLRAAGEAGATQAVGGEVVGRGLDRCHGPRRNARSSPPATGRPVVAWLPCRGAGLPCP